MEGTSSRFGSKKGRKLVTLTNIQKKELCEYKNANPSKTYEEIGAKFGIGKSTVGDILGDKGKWLAITESSGATKRDRGGEWPQLEEALAIWIDNANRANNTITGSIICQKALDYARRLEIIGFTASQGWLTNFKKRKGVKEYYKAGEAASAPIDDLLEFRAELKSLIAEYDLNDVYNADETALYWKLEPNKTLSSGPITGTKKP